MGVFKMSTGTVHVPASVPRPTGNPNPYRFEVLETKKVGEALVAKVRYPDCFNYEGVKILVYSVADKFEMMRACGTLDPHFSDDGMSPVARFEPTERGWELAIKLAKTL